MAEPRKISRTRMEAIMQAEYQALMDAADAWDALSPEELHQFAKKNRHSVATFSLPSVWLRMRAMNHGF